MEEGECVYFMESDEGVEQPKETWLNLFYFMFPALGSILVCLFLAGFLNLGSWDLP